MTYTVVVVAYRSRAPLLRFLDGLQNVPTIVVDNSSEEDDLSDLGAQYAFVTVVDAGGNVGFSAGANLGARYTHTPIVIFMNPDTAPSRSILDAVAAPFEDDSTVLACGPAGIGTAGGGAQPTIPRVLAHVAGLHRVLPLSGIYFYPRSGERVDAGWISGSCCAIRRDVFESLGGYDESYFVFMSDFELGRRVAGLGGRQLVLGDVVMRHVDGGSSDLPASWTWDQRGRGWAQYLRRTRGPARGWVIWALLTFGFLVRGIVYRLTGRSLRAEEQATMGAALRDEWRQLGRVTSQRS